MRKNIHALVLTITLWLACMPAFAAVNVSSYFYGVGRGPLGSLISSTVFELDATNSASTDGTSQTWANLETSPADGSAQTAYDFYRGNTSSATTDDPTFNGTAGNANAYWSLDGGDNFTLASGTNPNFLRDIHKTTGGSDFWIAYAYRDSSHGGAAIGWVSTATNSSTGHGIIMTSAANSTTTGRVSLNQMYGAVNSQYYPRGIAPSTDNVVIYSHSHSLNQTRVYVNGWFGERSDTFGTTTTDGQHKMSIGSLTATGTFIPTGARIYAVAMGNAYITETDMNTIRTYLDGRTNAIYTQPNTAALGSFVSSTVFQIDANIKGSWDDGEAAVNPANLTPSPADGSATSAYDFTNNGSMLISGFNGSAFWNPTTTSSFLQLTGSNTTFLNNLHKTTGGQDFWFASVISGDAAWGATVFWATTTSATGIGMGVNLTTAEQFLARQYGTGATTASLPSTVSTTPVLFVASYSHTNNNWRYALNSSTFTDAAHTFNTTTSSASGPLTLGAYTGGTVGSGADLDWYGFSMGNVYADNTVLSGICGYYSSVYAISFC